MATVFVFIVDFDGVPLTGLSPVFDFWDKSSPGAPSATGQAMTELVGGIGGAYFADVATTDGREYVALVDAGATAQSRYSVVSFSGEVDARLSTDIPAILVDTAAIDARLPADPADESVQLAAHAATQALVTGLNDLSIADVQTALTNQGYTTARAAFLDELAAANLPSDIDAILLDTGTTLPGLIAALNDLSIADVQTALTNQGYTAVRAALLDNLDATISSVLAAIAALNDISVTNVLDGDVTGRVATPNSLGRIVDMLDKLLRGRLRINPTLNQLELYDPADDTVLLTWPLTDFGGGGISNVTGSPFDRAKAVET